MNKTKFFRRELQNDLFAASIAISQNDWVFDTSNNFRNNKESVIKLMRDYRFDIHPIKDSKNKFSLYAVTKESGDYSLENIEQVKIVDEKDTIYYLTHIRDVIQMMVENDRNFYFLSDYTSNIGLITLSDLNNKYFYHWLYQRLVNLEHLLVRNLDQKLDENTIISKIQEVGKKNNDMGRSFSDTLIRYNIDVLNNTDSSILEYLTFKQIIEIYSEFDLYKEIGYKNLNDFQKGNKALGEIRNTVAHPTRSLISGRNSLKMVWKGILKMENLSEKLALFVQNKSDD